MKKVDGIRSSKREVFFFVGGKEDVGRREEGAVIESGEKVVVFLYNV